MTTFKNGYNYDVFCIHTDEGEFYISFENNLDLYWSYIPEKSILDCDDTKEFTITKENDFIYDAFNELYNAIKFSMPYRNSLYETDLKYKKYKTYNWNQEQVLFKNGVIEWHSDDFNYDNASVVSIDKTEKGFKVIFKKSIDDGLFISFFVRFRNSGSSYTPFNIPFMSMYQKLKQYDFDYHQMSIDEYLESAKQKKIGKKSDFIYYEKN